MADTWLAQGSMFWFSRKTFVGSYSRFSATSRWYFSRAVGVLRDAGVAEEVDVGAAGRGGGRRVDACPRPRDVRVGLRRRRASP